MKKTVFTGSGVAIITPFTENGVNYDELGRMLDYHIENGTDSIIICGTTGEASTMPDEEHCATIKYAVDRVAGKIPVIAGTGSNDTPHAIKLTKFAESAGADAILTVTPYYNKATQKGLIEHFTAIANSVKIPVILYNVPSRTGCNIKPETLKELSKIDNIVAVKEASGDLSQVAKIASICGDELDIYSGNDDQILPVLSLGGKGVISVVANVAPKETHDMVYKFLEGNIKEAKELQLGMIELCDALFCEVNPIPVKTALGLMGWNTGHLRLPLTSMEENTLNQLKTAMKNYGLIK
ncbi:MAG: 4-hydroxy-tetrahydrodipicolinate synthase [Ruminococcaceae bacterium]|nr:4-hydroxy-tetrahydrodipicolinate synthase [Oscillospiraceae bacterium]